MRFQLNLPLPKHILSDVILVMVAVNGCFRSTYLRKQAQILPCFSLKHFVQAMYIYNSLRFRHLSSVDNITPTNYS